MSFNVKFLDILADKLIETELFEMAFNRKDAESKITSLGVPIIEHLIKIFKWKDDLNYHKHIGDINGWLYKIQDIYLKGNTKPSANNYFQWIFVDNVRLGEVNIRRTIKALHRYHHLPVLRTDEEVYDIIKAILYKVSMDLPLNTFEDIENYYTNS